MSDCGQPSANACCLIGAACSVLCEPHPLQKQALTEALSGRWRGGGMCADCGGAHSVPARPARRDDVVRVVPPSEVPKLGRAGTAASRVAILHSLAHIESWAVDLAWDAVARFGGDTAYRLPRAFFDDFVEVAADECRHFALLSARLQELGSYYGALPAHDGLWESAAATAHSLAARLAVEHCVHEARGLDVLPTTIRRFRAAGDAASAQLLEGTVLPEEVTHCAAGVRWLRHLHRVARGAGAGGRAACGRALDAEDANAAHQRCTGREPSTAACCFESAPDLVDADATAPADAAHSNRICSDVPAHSSLGLDTAAASANKDGCDDWRRQARECSSVQEWFHVLVHAHFKGVTKPPFNDKARAEAGFDESWYLPLTAKAAAA